MTRHIMTFLAVGYEPQRFLNCFSVFFVVCLGFSKQSTVLTMSVYKVFVQITIKCGLMTFLAVGYEPQRFLNCFSVFFVVCLGFSKQSTVLTMSICLSLRYSCRLQ